MDHKQYPILHDLLQLDQEPFHLKTFISDKRSHLNTPPPASALTPGGAFLHVPSSTAAVLAEAAARIRKQHHSKPRMQIKNAGLSLFGSFLKLLMKHRSSVRNRDFEERLPIRPCGFSLYKFSGHRRSPDSSSPASSPSRRAKQDNKEHCVSSAEEEKEQRSPVSVLDTFFVDDEHESLAGEEDDHDHDQESSYENIERARKQLLERLERFEKLAALDQVDLEQKLLEAYDEFEQLPLSRKQGWDTDTSSILEQSPMKVSAAYMRRLIGEDQAKIVMGHLAREAAVDMVTEWGRWSAEETAAEVEVAIFGELIEECFAWIENDSTM